MSQQTVLVCSQCGRMLADSDLVQIAGNWVCGDCKPAFLSRVMASGAAGASPLGWRYGGFWIRVAARFIDGFVLTVPATIVFGILAALFLPNLLEAARTQAPPSGLLTPVFAVAFLILFLAGLCYEVVMLRYQGATVGKIACGLKVIRSDGRSLGWGVCFGRFFMWNVVTSGIPYLNFVLMSISCIMAGVDGEKRALHDRVCDTRVVYKQSLA